MRIGPFGKSSESLRQPLPIARLVAFALVGLFCLGYLLFSVIGTKTFEGQYDVKVQMTATGGLFPGSQVTYRGVPIGIVRSIDVTPSRTGVVATLAIHDGVHVPTATLAVVADRSPAGEQYIDFQPTGAGPPYLAGDSVIPVGQVRLPPSLSGLLNSVSAFSGSVNLKELRSVFTQLNLAFANTGPALGQIIDNTAEILSTLQSVEPQTIDLLDNAGKVLDTQNAHRGDLHTFAVSLRSLADTLRSDSPKTTRLIGAALNTSNQVGPLIAEDAKSLSGLLSNLVTVGSIVDDRLPGLRVLLAMLPKSLNALASGVHGGHVLFHLLAQTGRACKYSTRRQMPYVDHKGGPIVNDYCLHPTTKEQQRGSVYAPRPPGDDTNGPSAQSNASTASSTASGQSNHAGRAHSTSWINILSAGEL